jgi:hypothetical protein
METLLEATQRLRRCGFDEDFAATAPGQLWCDGCGKNHDPADMVVDEIVRYEGASDPDDQTILLALDSACGRRGLFSAAFGPTAPAREAEVLQRLPR